MCRERKTPDTVKKKPYANMKAFLPPEKTTKSQLNGIASTNSLKQN